MARPLRRVLISLSIRLHIDVDVIEQWSMRKVREYVAVLTEDSRPKAEEPIRAQSSEELNAALMRHFGKPGTNA
jgi:hypothetical protein